ncbi:WD40-repeat-containing domain protein [Mycena belliarum]|uniref:WD40-repeat-containing domain protein n=1 Tax=Mycena belliarum TaxID=1033014 RepID=A0AAD6U7I8_9AGAR|nr:WD40-repeat-containing domain protein [Mycena belliae]KAJ7085362.1 WD40-repeat-containing domain protein [Mycena belliae]KAJ7092360.1 WD40-repeat-containing domain protein [Mycena belliae]
MEFYPAENKIDYRLQGKLVGHSGAVLALGVHNDGKFVASGGTDGTKVWDLATIRSIAQIPGSPDIRGATTSLRWIKRDDDVREALVYGTQAGYLVCWVQDDVVTKDSKTARFIEVWCRQLNDPAEITGIAFDETTNRLAACHRGGVFQVFTLNAKMSLKEVVLGTISRCTPGAVAFGEMHGNERELLVFGVHCGLVYTVRGKELCTAAEAWNLGCKISAVAVDHRQSIMCVDDPSTGVHLYRLNGTDRELVNSFPVPVKKRRRVRQVALMDSGRVIVSSSDHGTIYVRSRRAGKLLAKLRVDPDGYVQTVAAADIAGVPTIFAAKSCDHKLVRSSPRYSAMAFVYDKVGRQLAFRYFAPM